ncbi:Protein N-acetyltransferase, RimJ/RimL family [Chitinophaga sp. CF118]|uniref:GNAT family N-acetyltransferase n=1 Tax=Chitinophaga sp. CF118 TaxID=1884367 RepID=UPI0008E7659E|nr:GNAT family protein [Chitinophaga sp. CF118]SFD00891.1 Protein N-acetyltransferase, RimJ/RimL family [Chitinophaga sp. CF118]
MQFKANLSLESDSLLLKPVSLDDLDSLRTIAFDEDLWLYTPTKVSDGNLQSYLESGINDWQANRRMMFSIYQKQDGKIMGSTSIGNFDFKNRRAEIGWTWLGNEFQGKGFNEECKYLLLSFCFDELSLHRVEFKTDVNNIKSRKALRKIGAVEEGVLRQHTLLNNGKWRDTIYYSILESEWTLLKELYHVS